MVTEPGPSIPDSDDRIAHLARRGQRWLRESALPLWAHEGFDKTCDCFEEGLAFDRTPLRDVPRRVMVQARQISVFARAALAGEGTRYRDMALAGTSAMIDRYWRADGEPGWVFAVDRNGRVLDSRRDLYGHAFVIYALAIVLRLEPNRAAEEAIAATLAFLDTNLADPLPGSYRDCRPRPDALRRQNPHMHLFEAFLALYETTRDPAAMARCTAVLDLALSRMIDRDQGAVREVFDDRWQVVPAPGQGRVEPGHLFEWAWLLDRYDDLAGSDHSADMARLTALAVRGGLDAGRGRIVDEIGEDGIVRLRTSRSWPHAEALKALAVTSAGMPAHHDLIAPIAERLLTVYCPDRLGGGWVDHVDERDEPMSRFMPASTLYHLHGGFTALERFASGRDGAADGRP